MRRETGRELVIAGPVSLAWSLTPTIALHDLSLANPPGFPQPLMAHVDGIRARLAVLPLLERRIVVDQVEIVSPDIRLATDAAGQPNWRFSPPPRPAPTVDPAPRSAVAPGPRWRVDIGTVEVTDATLRAPQGSVELPTLLLDLRSGRVSGTVRAAGAEMALSGTVSPSGWLESGTDVRLAGPGFAASVVGNGGVADATITVPDLAALSPLAGKRLPPVHDLVLSARLPGPAELRLGGHARFGRLQIDDAVATAPSLTAPARFTARVAVDQRPLALSGTIGSLAALIAGSTPVEARLEGPGLVATLAGPVGTDGIGTLQTRLTVADLAALDPVLPPAKGVEASAALSVAPGRLAATGLHLTSAQGDLSGDLAWSDAGRPMLRAALVSTRLDLDALAPARPIAAPPPETTPAPLPEAAPAPAAARVIPDTPLPLDALRAADADLHLTAATIRLEGRDYRGIQAHAVLADGTLRVDPASMAVGSATARGTLLVQAAAQPPVAQATIAAPGLPFGDVLAVAGGEPDATGTLDLHADLAGTGTTLRGLAATLSGHVWLSLIDGHIDNALLERMAAGPVRALGLPFDGGGGTTVRCAVMRADAAAGTVKVATLALDTSKLALTGSGTIHFGDETVDLHLRPQLRVGGGLSVPLRVRGSLAGPKVALDTGAFASGRSGFRLGGPPPPDTCGPALAAKPVDAPKGVPQ